jgi:hypothetical protein
MPDRKISEDSIKEILSELWELEEKVRTLRHKFIHVFDKEV